MAFIKFLSGTGEGIWINPLMVSAIEHADESTPSMGAILHTGAGHITVTETVREVKAALERGQKSPWANPLAPDGQANTSGEGC